MQLVDGELANVPHGHDNVIVTLQNLADFHTHQGVQTQVRQCCISVQTVHIPHT